MSRILVAYVSRNGSTAEIAQAIGKELEKNGKSVDVAEMKAVRSLEGYGAAVLGGPLYMGSVVSDVKKFVGRHRAGLEQIPVVAFTVGLAPVNPEPMAVIEAMESLHKAIEPVTPVECQVFAGRLDPEKLTFIQRKITEMVKSPVGDFRDWGAICSWARRLPEVLHVQ